MVVSTGEQHSFTHVGPGTPTTAWRRHAEWGTGETVSLDGVDHVVVVAAHPDDESLGAGGLIACARRLGIPVDIVCATDGEGSHPDSPTCPPEQLAVVRAAEGRQAAAVLGVGEDRLRRLALPDGAVTGSEDAVTTAVVEIVGDGRRSVIVAPWRRDGHPDHEAAGRAAATAARRTGADLWEFPIWFWHWGHPEDAPWVLLRRFDLDAEAVATKGRAIGAHASQVTPLSQLPGDETLLAPELLAHFTQGPETYLRTASADCPDDSLDQLHQTDGDPWGVESRWYEQRKRDLVLAMLPRPRFERAIEVGCSTGALAAALADRCGQVLAVDRSSAALAAARRRFEADERVTVAGLDVGREWPQDATFDLVVVSEVGYFLSPVELEALVGRIAGSLTPDGVVVLCHWRHRVEGWVLDADAVHGSFRDPRLPEVNATYVDRDVEIRIHAREHGWPSPLG